MASVLCPEVPAPGFSFDNCARNNLLVKRGFPAPSAVKTGTTIVGVVYKDGVVLGADTRATSGDIIADKIISKIHPLAANIYCCGAGTSADTTMTTRSIASQLELHRLNTGRIVPVVTANKMLCQMLFRYQGYIGAALVLGGVDNDGPHLHTIFPHGSCDTIPYCSMGSGSLAAMAVFEARWKPNMTEEEAKHIVRDAVAGGVYNDLFSGNNIDLCVIRKGSVEYIRPYEVAEKKGERVNSYRFKKGTTVVLKQQVVPIQIEEEVVRRVQLSDGTESMDTN